MQRGVPFTRSTPAIRKIPGNVQQVPPTGDAWICPPHTSADTQSAYSRPGAPLSCWSRIRIVARQLAQKTKLPVHRAWLVEKRRGRRPRHGVLVEEAERLRPQPGCRQARENGRPADQAELASRTAPRWASWPRTVGKDTPVSRSDAVHSLAALSMSSASGGALAIAG